MGSVLGWRKVGVRRSVGRGEGKVWGEWKNVWGGVRKCVGVWDVCWGVGKSGGSKERCGGVERNVEKVREM